MKTPPFLISITTFLWLASSLLLVVFIAVCLGFLFNMREVGERASEVRQIKMPEVEETQRSFLNLESLRRLAEVVYLSDDPRTRRAARIKAQAMASESVFTRNSAFSRKARELSVRINELADCRGQESAIRLRVRTLEKVFLSALYQVATAAADDAIIDQLLDPALSLFLFRSSAVISAEDAATQLARTANADQEYFSAIQNRCLKQAEVNPPLAPVCARLEDIRNEYMQIMRELSENLTEASALWEVVDEDLREMRDIVRSDAEFDAKDALTSIETTSKQAVRTAIVLAAGGVASFLVYLAGLHLVLVRPVRWAGRKLMEIQQGNLHSPAPVIHITEMHQVGDLLDRFSVHLAELTSQASQLAEDAAHKRDLEAIMTALFQVSVNGYCVWQPSRMLTVNAELLRQLGFADRQELEDRLDQVGFTPRAQLPALYEEVLTQGFQRREAWLTSRDGERIPFELSSIPLKRQDGMWIFSYFRDLRQQKQTEKELRAAKDEAEEAARIKSDFLARMSHEIRTPMNGVLGLTHLALKNSPPPAQKKYLQKIQASARILLGVINDILDFSKMESGRLTLENRPFAFSALLNTVADLFGPLATEKGLHFCIEADPRLPEYVVGDELRLSQVLLNLCGNAVKFTETGSVTLRVRLKGEGEGSLKLYFAVIDSGVGMTQQQVTSLFQPFVQADVSTTRKYGGTGLGLVISKLLVSMMQGNIEVTSEPGKGSVFFFTVVLGAYTGLAKAVESASSAPVASLEELRGLRVLLAEDNEINQEVAVTMLENLGCTTIVAANGAEALRMLESNEVDCVLMDIQMPVMDGLDATRAIRQDSRETVRSLPIIAMTAHAMQEDMEKSLAAGMDDHIIKPIDPDLLRAALQRAALRRNPQS